MNLKPGIWPDVKCALEGMPEIREKFYTRLFKDKGYYQQIFELIETECTRHGVKFEK